jgi:hypothetical protein
VCVLCAINNLFQTLGGEYTAEEFGQYIDKLRAGRGLEPLNLRSWFSVEDIIESVFDKDIVTRRDGETDIYDDETYIIWTGYGNSSHLIAVSDGWLFDSKRDEPVDLLSLRQTLPDGGTAVYTVNKDKVRGIWILDVPTKSKSSPLPVLQFARKKARTVADQRASAEEEAGKNICRE